MGCRVLTQDGEHDRGLSGKHAVQDISFAVSHVNRGNSSSELAPTKMSPSEYKIDREGVDALDELGIEVGLEAVLAAVNMAVGFDETEEAAMAELLAGVVVEYNE